jgi:hypothetical protein
MTRRYFLFRALSLVGAMPMNVTPYTQRGSAVIPTSHALKVRTGAYRLEVQATDSAGRTTPWRTANFTVQ